MQIFKTISFLCMITTVASNSGNDTYLENEDLDPVIDLLLNGGSFKDSNEIETETDSTLSGIWKCGNCTDIDEARIAYSEEYFTDDDDDDNDGSMQIELVLEGMRCVTVTADKSGVVQRLTGACDGVVTLHVKPSRRFIVHVYV